MSFMNTFPEISIKVSPKLDPEEWKECYNKILQKKTNQTIIDGIIIGGMNTKIEGISVRLIMK